MKTSQYVQLGDGRHVGVHLAGCQAQGARTLVMHYGTPHTGRHPAPLVQLADQLQLRLLSVTRPGFPGSARRLGRAVADGAMDAVEIIGLLRIDRVMTAGYSGGGPHALALAALMPERVEATAVFACPAPFDPSPSWFAGMAAGGGGLRAAARGRAAREAYQRSVDFDADSFTTADWAALEDRWGGIGQDAQAAAAAGSDDGQVDDDLAFTAPWGVELGRITGKVELFQGVEDRIIPLHHVELLASALPEAEVHKIADSGHVAVLDEFPRWMRRAAGK